MTSSSKGIPSNGSFRGNLAIFFFVALQLAGFSQAGAQDQSGVTQVFLNPYVLNPSYAGFDGQPSASFSYRKQWMTIDGAPTLANRVFMHR